jgi:hypothetical protein
MLSTFCPLLKGGKQVRVNAGKQMRMNHYRGREVRTSVFQTGGPKDLVTDSSFPARLSGTSYACNGTEEFD